MRKLHEVVNLAYMDCHEFFRFEQWHKRLAVWYNLRKKRGVRITYYDRGRSSRTYRAIKHINKQRHLYEKVIPTDDGVVTT